MANRLHWKLEDIMESAMPDSVKKQIALEAGSHIKPPIVSEKPSYKENKEENSEPKKENDPCK